MSKREKGKHPTAKREKGKGGGSRLRLILTRQGKRESLPRPKGKREKAEDLV